MTRSAGCTTADAEDLIAQLPQVTRGERQRYVRFQVAGSTFAYSWATVGPSSQGASTDAREERACVRAQRRRRGSPPEGAGEAKRAHRHELAELIFEAWRLTAPAELVEKRADQLPS